MHDEIYLGNDIDTFEKVSIGKSIREGHVHVLGPTRSGKSKMLEHMIRQDILNRKGLTLIDPHGYFFNDIVRWLTSLGLHRSRKIIIFDPSLPGWSPSFNPLNTGTSLESVLIDSMINSVSAVWGSENQNKTPLLKRVLRVLFRTLIEKNLSLSEGFLLAQPENIELRKIITENMNDPITQSQWDYYNNLKPKQFAEEFSSSINRLMEFCDSDILSLILGQIDNPIDFKKIMDEEYICLVNLSSGRALSRDSSKTLGALIINDLFLRAFERKQNSKAHYLYIDECHLFLNKDIESILSESSKYGLRLILANQHLGQLREAGDGLFNAVMNNAKVKMVFGGQSSSDAREMAEHIFLGEIDYEEPKISSMRPVVVGYKRIKLKNDSRSQSITRGESDTIGESSSNTISSSQGSDSSLSIMHEMNSDNRRITRSRGDSFSSAESESYSFSTSKSYSHSEQEGYSEGENEALEAVFKDMPTQYFSKDEQLDKLTAKLVKQPQAHFVLKIPKEKSRFIKVPFVKDAIANDQRCIDFEIAACDASDICRRTEEAKAFIENRKKELFRKIENNLLDDGVSPEYSIIDKKDDIVIQVPDSWNDIE